VKIQKFAPISFLAVSSVLIITVGVFQAGDESDRDVSDVTLGTYFRTATYEPNGESEILAECAKTACVAAKVAELEAQARAEQEARARAEQEARARAEWAIIQANLEAEAWQQPAAAPTPQQAAPPEPEIQVQVIERSCWHRPGTYEAVCDDGSVIPFIP
jgi:hypothetical protein